jgi:hypothetical protein
VGLRMRGQFSLHESGDKKPWKLITDAYIDGQEYFNLKQLIFLNNIGDASLIKEKLSYEMMRFAGAPASHLCFVEIWIDLIDDNQPTTFWGIYSMVERVDYKYIGNRFGQANDGGNLYKASHAQRGPMDLVYYGDSIEDYPTQNGNVAYGKVRNAGDNDYTDLLNLIRVLDGTTYDSTEDFSRALEQVINVDSFLRYLAVITATSNWDSYLYTGNNYFLYANPSTGIFEWIPWDLTWGNSINQPLFSRNDFGLVPRVPMFDKVIQVEKYRWKYAAYLDLLVRHWFNYQNVYSLSETYYNLIAPKISQGEGDKMFYGSTAWFTPQEFHSAWQELAVFAQQRSVFILQSLANFQESPMDSP